MTAILAKLTSRARLFLRRETFSDLSSPPTRRLTDVFADTGRLVRALALATIPMMPLGCSPTARVSPVGIPPPPIPTSLPVQPEELKKGPEVYVYSTTTDPFEATPPIIELARKIYAKGGDPIDVLMRTLVMVRAEDKNPDPFVFFRKESMERRLNTVRFEYEVSPDFALTADQALKRKKGDCSDFAYLVIALIKQLNILGAHI